MSTVSAEVAYRLDNETTGLYLKALAGAGSNVDGKEKVAFTGENTDLKLSGIGYVSTDIGWQPLRLGSHSIGAFGGFQMVYERF